MKGKGFPKPPDCTSPLSGDKALVKAMDLASEMTRKACCAHHAFLGTLLLWRQLTEASAKQYGLDVTAEEIRQVSQAYTSAFQISQRNTVVHMAAMLEACAMTLMLGKTEDERKAEGGEVGA